MLSKTLSKVQSEVSVVNVWLEINCNSPLDTSPQLGLAPVPPVSNACPLVPALSLCRPEPSR